MPVTAAAAVALAGMLDAAVAEPPESVHPVALFGRAVAPLDRPWANPLAVGAVGAVVGPTVAAVAVGGAVAVGARIDPWAGAGLAGLVLFATISRRMLCEEALGVVAATDTDPSAARDRLRTLVGRDVAALSPGEVRSAAVESAAENLADGLVGPLAAFALGALVAVPVAAGAAAWVKGVDTMDSMLGYHSKPVGRASAWLDDVTMFLPARLAAGLVAVAALDPRALRRARAWAGEPASPNSGWPMATLSASLGTRLRKPGAYTLGAGQALPDGDRAREGVRIVSRAGVVALVVAGVVAWF